MTREHKARLFFELERVAAVSGLSAFIGLTLYGLPTLLEWVLSHFMSPHVVCGVVGDTAGYLALLSIGFRRMAGVVFILSKVLEATVLKGHIIPLDAVLWLTDMVPTLMCVIVMCHGIFYSDRDPRKRFFKSRLTGR